MSPGPVRPNPAQRGPFPTKNYRNLLSVGALLLDTNVVIGAFSVTVVSSSSGAGAKWAV